MIRKNEGLQNRKFYGNVNHTPRHNNVTTQQQQQINQTIELFTHRCIYKHGKKQKRMTHKTFLLYCVNSLAAETTRHFSKFSRIWLGAKYVLLKEQFTLN